MILLQTFHLDLVSSGAFDPRARRPNEPVVLAEAAPRQKTGTITLGGRRYVLSLTHRSYGPPILSLDANLDGKLEPSEGKPMEAQGGVDENGKPIEFYRAVRMVKSPYGGDAQVSLRFTYAPKYPSFHVGVDYARRGHVSIGGRRYRAELRDHLHHGNFAEAPTADGIGILLRVDLNENGKFDSRGEAFVVGKPFRVRGQSYEIRVPRPDGSQVQIVPSTAEVAEVPPPYVPRRGEPVPSFATTALDGRTVRFPDDFRGRPVLIDFVGRWSNETKEAAPAMAELSKADLAIVSVGIDFADSGPKVAEFAKEKGMTWPVLFEKEGWKGPIAQTLDATRVPSRFLVDGNGRLLATPEELTNERLAATLGRVLRITPPAAATKMATVAIPPDVRDKALFVEVQRRVKADQQVRLHWLSGGQPEGLDQWSEAVDLDNLRWLKVLLKKRGWPGKSVLGKKGSHDVWLMVQHCDRDRPFQQYALELLRGAVKAGEADGRDLAYLTDRVLTGMGKKQLYGTQMTSAGGWLRPLDIEDEANVDKRRAEVGLEPIKEYVESAAKMWRIPTTPPKVGG